MRAKWVIWIGGGIVVLGFGFLLCLGPPPGRFSAQLMGTTENGKEVVLVVTNGTRLPYVFQSWTQHETNGAWKSTQSALSHRHSSTLVPGQTECFTLEKPQQKKQRVMVQYGRMRESGL